MVSVRVTRIVAEVLAAEGDVAGASRLDVQVAGGAAETATGETVQVTRVAAEVLGDEGTVAGANRLDVQVAGDADEPSTGETVLVTRISAEVLASPDAEAAATRLDVQVAGDADEPSTGETVRVSRIVAEVLARQGSAGPVVPLALNTDSEFFLHNWAVRAELTSSYNNNVRVSPHTGAESRRGFRVKPDRSVRIQWMTNTVSELDRLEVFLRRITDSRFQVPIYKDQVELSSAYADSADTISLDTSKRRFFVGARAVVVRLDACNQYVGHSFHTIDTLTSSSLTFDAALGVAVPAGSLVMPVLDCEILLGHQVDFKSALTAIVTLDVQEVAGPSTLPPVKSDNPSGFPTFNDKPIFNVEPDWIQGVKRGRSRQGNTYTQGRTELVYTAASRARVIHQLQLSGDRDEMWSVVEFFDTRRGRLRSFYLTDQEQTFDIAAIDAGGDFVSVSEVGDFDDFNEEWDLLGLKMLDGTEYVREVISVQQVLTVFRLTVDPPLPAGLAVTDVARVARARTTRFASDEMVEKWTHTGHMSTTLNFIEVLNERNAPLI